MSPTTLAILSTVFGIFLREVLSILPIDYYAFFGGGYTAKYEVLPVLVVLYAAAKYYRKTPPERQELHEKVDRAVTRLAYPARIAVGGVLGVAALLYFPVTWELRPAPMPVGRGHVPPVMASRPEFVFYLPIPDQLPPPQTVERKIPPKKKMLDSKLFPFESMLAQLPVAPRVDFTLAPDEETPKPVAPGPPINLRIVAAP
jgi:hypothetical protein